MCWPDGNRLPGAGHCSRATPLPTALISSPDCCAISTADRSGLPRNDGTITPLSTSRTTVPLVGACPAGAGCEGGVACASVVSAVGGLVSTGRQLQPRAVGGLDSGLRRPRRGLRGSGLVVLHRSAQVIRRLIDVIVLRRRQQLLPLRILHIQIVRHVQIFQHLLRNSLEHRRANLPALVQSDWRIKNHGNRDRRDC